MIMSFVFDTASADDCERVWDLICQLEKCRLPFEPFREMFAKQVKSTHYCCLVAREEADAPACAILNLRFENQLHHAARVAEILEFIVDEPHRGKGIGAALLEEAQRVAKEMGCMQLEVTSNRTRTEAHGFYESQGMVNSHVKLTLPFGEINLEDIS